MRRFAPKTLVLALAAFGFLAATAIPAQARDEADKKKFANTLGHAVITCVRPSTLAAEQKPYMTGYKYSSPKTGRLDITVQMRFFGVWTGNPYDAKFTIKMDLNGTPEILGIDYTDDCLVPAPDVRLLNALIRTLNEKFKEQDR